MVTDACGRIDKIMPFIPSPWPVIRPGDRTFRARINEARKLHRGSPAAFGP
jgi:hypothetical protein